MISNVGRRYTPQRGLVIRKSSLVIVLFIFALIGLHLRLTLYAGSTPLVPYYLFLFSTAVMVLMFQREILSSVGIPLTVLAVFVLFMPLLSWAPSSGYAARLPSLLSFLVSIISSIGLYVALRHVPPARLRRVVIGIWVAFIVLAVLESIGLKPVFNAIRDVVYAGSGRGVYDAVDRDLLLYGQARPTVFASEPSFLAYTLSILMFLAAVLHQNPKSRRAFGRYFGMLLISYYIAPSFTYIFFLMAIAIWVFWPRTSRGMLICLMAIAVGCILAFLLRGVITGLFFQIVGSRTETASFFGRILVAPQAGLQTLAQWPLFGVGVGNDEAALPIIKQLWSDSGAYALFPWFRNSALEAQDLMSNGFWWQWMFLGIFGGIAFTGMIAWILRNLGVEHPARSILCCWAIWYPGAAFVDAGTWVVLAVVSMSAVASTRRQAANSMA